ncbi:MAG: hypothetical protein PHY08_12785 [Candidatus Cloacimonetes bacterium]|nr:hypothetical protein [Candidatus Cloacimonadota bacterium]
MKVVCIINEGCEYYLTIGKEYECLQIIPYGCSYKYSYRCYIIDDNNNRGNYFTYRFITLDEYRDKKLEELGI